MSYYIGVAKKPKHSSMIRVVSDPCTAERLWFRPNPAGYGCWAVAWVRVVRLAKNQCSFKAEEGFLTCKIHRSHERLALRAKARRRTMTGRIKARVCAKCWVDVSIFSFVAEDENGECQLCAKKAPTARCDFVHVDLPKETVNAEVK